jgi:MFS family permease
MSQPHTHESHPVQTSFPRWVLIPAALAINLSVGQTYAFSVFNVPLTRTLGITAPIDGDWKLTTIGWIFTITYIFLGLSAGLLGTWQDRVGPRISGACAALLWAIGFVVSAAGVKLHAISLLYLGYGVLGGSGCGVGFTTPIAPLLRWFPDRRGMATGFAVMGFGGGAIIGAPLSLALMRHFASPTSTGVAETFLVLAAVNFAAMLAGALVLRMPPAGWAPAGFTPASVRAQQTARHIETSAATKTPQFYLLWSVLLLNVTAGLGVLGQAAAMIQEVFTGFSAAGAAAFVATLSFFNMGGRLLWAWLSDRVSRRVTYAAFFTVGPLLYLAVPMAARAGNLPIFIACFAAIMTIFGGGFALLPAYVADVFGTRHVNAIHGRLLTALSVAGVAGPVLVNYLREYQIGHGVAAARAYDVTMYIMAALLAGGFFCNYFVGPIAATAAVAERGAAAPAAASVDQRATGT